MEAHDILAGIAVLVGLIGIVVALIPGLILQLIAVFVWALEESTTVGWLVFVLAMAAAAAATYFKYAYPGRQLREGGIPGWLLALALLVAFVGLFVVPIIGAPIGFVFTIYLFERARHGSQQAWPSTKRALKAIVTATGIELAGGVTILLLFVAGTLLT